MIFVTGDTHIPYDIGKLSMKNFQQQKNLTRKDYVIILGDFGLYWKEDKTYKHWREILTKKNFTILWLDGNHSNFDWIKTFPITEWNGGKVQQTEDNIIHLMRGQVYDIDGLKFFTCGGATSIDKENRIEGQSWWKEEDISYAECEEALDNLEKADAKVDYVLTHTCPQTLAELMFYVRPMIDPTAKFLDDIAENLEYKHWYFGHWHQDKTYHKFTCLYNKIERIK